MLETYHGVVKAGQIQLYEPAKLPEGAQVLVVVEALDDWGRPFEALLNESNEDVLEINDEELVELVHQVRTELGQNRDSDRS